MESRKGRKGWRWQGGAISKETGSKKRGGAIAGKNNGEKERLEASC
jgi:hypothetical protein